jgi:N-acetylneuraminic acid mutarotase
MKYFIVFSFSFFTLTLASQSVGIGTATPDSSAILDLSSTNKGFLMPRMTTALRDAIPDPVQGLKIFNTDDRCEDTWDGTKWSKNCDYSSIRDTILPADRWTELESIPTDKERYSGFCFAIGDKIYLGMGFQLPNPDALDVWEYDIILQNWTRKNDFPGDIRQNVFSFTHGGNGYIIGGNFGLGEVWQYNPNADTWIQKTSHPNGVRNAPAGFVIGDKAYIGSGEITNAEFSNDFWEYNITNDSWTQKANIPGNARKWATGFAVNGKGYIGLGRGPTFSIWNKDMYEFDPNNGTNGTWTQKQDYPVMTPSTGVNAVVNFVIDNKIYIGTGRLDDSATNDFYKFDPLSAGNQWTAINDFVGIPRLASLFTSVGNKGYLSCGYLTGSDYLNDFWQYSPNNDTLKIYKSIKPADALFISDNNWTNDTANKLYAANTASKIGIGTKVPKVKLHVEGINDAGLADNSGLLMIGSIDGNNIVMDNNEIMARVDGNANQLILQNHGGDTQIGGKLGMGSIPSSLLHLKGLDGTDNRHIRLESNSSSEYTSIFAGTNFVVKNSSAFGDFYFRNNSNVDVFSVSRDGDIKFEGALSYKKNDVSISTTNPTTTVTVDNKTYITVTCTSNLCTTCSGSGCPQLILTDGIEDGQILVLRGVADPNKGLYMPPTSQGTTNYRLTSSFQMAENNFITLMWVASLGHWREVSRAVY